MRAPIASRNHPRSHSLCCLLAFAFATAPPAPDQSILQGPLGGGQARRDLHHRGPAGWQEPRLCEVPQAWVTQDASLKAVRWEMPRRSRPDFRRNSNDLRARTSATFGVRPAGIEKGSIDDRFCAHPTGLMPRAAYSTSSQRRCTMPVFGARCRSWTPCGRGCRSS